MSDPLYTFVSSDGETDRLVACVRRDPGDLEAVALRLEFKNPENDTLKTPGLSLAQVDALILALTRWRKGQGQHQAGGRA